MKDSAEVREEGIALGQVMSHLATDRVHHKVGNFEGWFSR